MELNKEDNFIALSKETKDFLKNLLKICKLIRIENLVIDSNGVRAQLKEEGIHLIQNENLPTFEFDALGINRLNVITGRLGLMSDNFEMFIEEKVIGNVQKDLVSDKVDQRVVLKIKLKDKKTEVDFKCGNPILMEQQERIIKRIKDPICFTFELDEETIATIVKAQSTLGETGINKALTFVGKGNKVTCKLIDEDGDTFTHLIDDNLQKTTDAEQEKFAVSYKNRIVVPVLREAMQGKKIKVNITKRGLMNLKLGDINIFVSCEL